MEAFLVAYHLQGDVLMGLVVVGLYHLAKATLTYHLQHLVPVGYMIVRYVDVRTLIVVVTAVVRPADHPLLLLGVRADEIDLGVIEDLVMLERRQLVHVLLHGRFWTHGQRPFAGRTTFTGQATGAGRRPDRRQMWVVVVLDPDMDAAILDLPLLVVVFVVFVVFEELLDL